MEIVQLEIGCLFQHQLHMQLPPHIAQKTYCGCDLEQIK